MATPRTGRGSVQCNGSWQRVAVREVSPGTDGVGVIAFRCPFCNKEFHYHSDDIMLVVGVPAHTAIRGKDYNGMVPPQWK